jgi:DNA (cytosine-5)-methyltransferase 1
MGQGGQIARCSPLAVTSWQGESPVRYGSVCSGIEAATVAWHSLGWEAAWYSEIEPFPCAVLKHHYPAVPNYGDMTRYEEWPNEPINLLVAGTPCQSFSVAGLRKGLADPRGNLMLTYGAIARRYRPEWLVWENVPGVLSSNGGRDFGTFLGMLAELGYGFAYRVLDAQYFGVAQRRRRVFVVANARSWQRAAAVLFESHSLQGHPAPSREAGKDVAGTFKARANSGGWGQHVDLAAGGYMQVAPTLCAQNAAKWGSNQWVDEGKAIVQTMSGEDIAPCLIKRMEASTGTTQDAQIISVFHSIAFSAQMSNPQTDVDLVQTLQAKNPMAVATPAYGIPGNWIGRAPENGGNAVEPMLDVAPCQTKTDVHAVAQPITQFGSIAGSLTARHDSSPCADRGQNVVAQPMTFKPKFFTRDNPKMEGAPNSNGTIGTLLTNDTGDNAPHVAIAMAVRRLTPVECERLQGFPDGYTNIPWRKATESPDGPRYKALGNSMAVPVMAWIGKRIQQVSEL